MPVSKRPFIPQQSVMPSLSDFESAIASLPTESDDAKLYTDIMKCVSLGILVPNRSQMEAIRLLFMKKVPDAPKDINLRAHVQVESIIQAFLSDNPINFRSALDLAAVTTMKELAIADIIEGDINAD